MTLTHLDGICLADGGMETTAYSMVNCAHPTHFAHVLDASGPLARNGQARLGLGRGPSGLRSRFRALHGTW